MKISTFGVHHLTRHINLAIENRTKHSLGVVKQHMMIVWPN